MTSRSTLLRQLTEACELEHGLACSYLYSAMTLKQEPDGQRLPAGQVPMVRQWASQVYFVASQEMLHLAQAWNLLTALGGTPYYLHPNFPQSSKYYPLHLQLALEPYGGKALDRFIAYEKPVDVLRREAAATQTTDGDMFQTIGELYELIAQGIKELPNAIVGDPNAQVGRALIDFPDIVQVVDVDSALAAIHLVTHQGEGNETDRTDCHYGIFKNLRESLATETKNNQKFEPAHCAILNPSTDTSEAYGARHATLITDTYTKEVAKLFDGLYSLMLRMLGHTFTGGGDFELRRALGESAIIMMATVVKPLGEGLTQLQAADEGGSTAGPPFGLTRHVTLPADSKAVRLLVTERLAELTAKTSELARSPRAIPMIGRVEATLRRMETMTSKW